MTNELIDMATLERVAPMILAVAHPLRLRILDFLEHEGGARNVSQIADAAAAPQAVVSQQLRILKDQRVLRAQRSGNYVLYHIEDASVLLLLQCIRRNQAR